MSGNAFERILGRLSESDGAVTEKTASAEPTTPSAEARMIDTVRRVSDATAKTASAAPAAGPAADLARMAKEAAETEAAILQKEAHAYGAALADGFMERFAQYDAALSKAGVKVAAPSEDLVKQAADEAYKRAVADMEKRAEDEFNRGYQETMAKVHKTAAELHFAGQTMAHNVVERLAGEKR
jgi:hypothetical protein